jgi:glycosyltransferase involved in cell wall biosynthesis
VVTVTYGDRAVLLRQLLERLTTIDGAEHIHSVVVVNNGGNDDTRRLLDAAMDVIVVDMGSNEGSAAGFAAGIGRALDEECDYLWLLDDDNLPEPGALAALLDRADPAMALQSFRPSYSRVARLVASGGRIPVYEVPDTIGSLLRRLLGRFGVPTRRRPSFRLPFATFGGFFASRSAFAAAGLPRLDFVMYGDDTEYTYRFPAAGVPITLVPESVVADVDTAWWLGEASSGSLGPRSLVSGEASRMYYTIRNSVFFERTRRVTKPVRYRVVLAAKHVAVAAAATLSCAAGRSLGPWRTFREYRRATADGLAGRLGTHGEAP